MYHICRQKPWHRICCIMSFVRLYICRRDDKRWDYPKTRCTLGPKTYTWTAVSEPGVDLSNVLSIDYNAKHLSYLELFNFILYQSFLPSFQRFFKIFERFSSHKIERFTLFTRTHVYTSHVSSVSATFGHCGSFCVVVSIQHTFDLLFVSFSFI